MTMADVGGFWRGRNVLVTGSSGFLGSWMVKELRARGAFVVGLLRDKPGRAVTAMHQDAEPDFVVHGQLEDYDCLLRAVNEYEIDCVMHLAAQPIVGTAYRDPRATFEANIRGTWNLLEACRQITTVKRIVVASSDKAYGTAERLPYDESMPLLGRHPYDVSKSCADMIAQAYHETYGVPVAITRAANFYGGGDLNFNRIVPGTIRSVLSGKPPVLRSDGTMVRDYIYVRDIVAAYLRLAEAMDDERFRGQAYNFSVEKPLTVLEITRKVLEAMGRPDVKPVILNEVKGEIPTQYLSAARARRELGWVPQFTLEESLAETFDWYKTYLGSTGESSPR
jgi:CDP-glucose 4,6-dehydratase